VLHFRLCGVPTVFRIDDAHLAGRLRLVLAHFAFSEGSIHADEIPLDVEISAAASPPPPDGDVVVDGWRGRVVRSGGRFWLATGDSSFDVDPAAGRAVGRIDEGFWTQSIVQQRTLFMLMLVMLMRSRRCYSIHASGAEHGGLGVLFVGPSGSGKSTLTLGLVQAGWRFLADDVVAVRQDGAEVQSLALRRTMSCSPATLGGLGLPGGLTEQEPGTDKDAFDVVAAFPDQALDVMMPRVIAFPEVTNRSRSALERIGLAETVGYLARSMAGILTDPEWAMRQLEVLATLAAQAPGYRLLVGRDVFDNTEHVAQLLTAETG